MPLSWTVSHPQRIVLAIARGTVETAEVARYLTALADQRALSYRKLFNAAGLEGMWPDDALRSFAEFVRIQSSANRIGPVAIVVGSEDAQRGVELYAAAASVNRPLKIFREHHEARRWLDTFERDATPRS